MKLYKLILIFIALLSSFFYSDAIYATKNLYSSAAELSTPQVGDKLETYGLSVSEGSGVTNFYKLCKALDTGNVIIVDGLYPITVTDPYILTKNIQLHGLNSDCGFVFNVTSSYVFLATNDITIDIERVKFTGHSNVIFSNTAMTNYIKSINVAYCTFTGAISLLDLNIADADFNIRHGIGEFTFNNNIISNLTVVSDPSKNFIDLKNLPFNKIEVFDNKVNNFVNSFLFAGTTNTYTDTMTLIDNRGLVYVHDNIVINDSSCISNYRQSIYHTFILAECCIVKYSNNHVEGLKALQQAVYDLYASSREVYYENNFWKNNLQLSEYPYSKGEGEVNNNCLIKSKGNPSRDGEVGYRLYKNNRFIIEEDFVTNLGYDKKWCAVGLANITGRNISYTIEDNYVDVSILHFQLSSQTAPRYIFNRNTIRAKGITGYVLNQKAQNSNIEICDNSIISELPISGLTDYVFDQYDLWKQFEIIHQYDTEIVADTLTINGNHIETDLAKNLILNITPIVFESRNNMFIDIKTTGVMGDVLYKFRKINKSMLISNTSVKTCAMTTVPIIFPVQSDVKFRLITPSFSSGLIRINTGDYATNVAVKNCLVEISIKVQSELMSYVATYELTMTNGMIYYKKSDGTIGEYAINGLDGTTTRYIDPDTGNLLARLRLWDTSTLRQITLDMATPIPNAVVDVNITVR